jgi:hypothetical protein
VSGRLDQRGPRPAPLPVSVQGENLALLPVLPRHVREHAQQLPAARLGHQRRMVQGMNQPPQPATRRLLCRARNAPAAAWSAASRGRIFTAST